MSNNTAKKTYGNEKESKSLDINLLKRLMTFLYPYKWTVVLAIILLFATKFLTNIVPRIIQEVIDGPIANKNLNALIYPVGLLLSIRVFEFVIIYFQIYITQYIGQNAVKELRLQLFTKTLKFSKEFFSKNPVGALMSRIVNDVDILSNLFSNGIINIFGDLATIVFILFFMFTLNVTLTLIVLASLPIVILISWLFKTKVRKKFQNIRIETSNLNSFLHETITGMNIIRLFGQEKRNSDRFNIHNTQYRNLFLRMIKYYSIFYPLMELVYLTTLTAILWYGGASKFSTGITIGTLVAFAEYIRYIFEPIKSIAEKYQTLQEAMASSERIFTLLDSEEILNLPNANKKEIFLDKGIEFKNVSFSYNKEIKVLDNISFKIHKGEALAIVGSTGSGKSTIINLLRRFYLPNSGEIKLGNVNLNLVDPKILTTTIGTVPQDMFLFSDSVINNIDPSGNSQKEDVIKTSIQTNTHSFISMLPNEYSTILKEAGADLSLGQRQLLSIARLLHRNPEIIILDEATSSIDPANEEIIKKILEKLFKNKTSLIVAHRLSTIEQADRILVLHKGRIAEEGKHQDLIDKKGLYYKLYNLQKNNLDIPLEKE